MSELDPIKRLHNFADAMVACDECEVSPTGEDDPVVLCNKCYQETKAKLTAAESRCQQMEQALTRIAGIGITGGGPYLIGENAPALALAALAPRTGPQTPTIRDAFDAGFLSDSNDSDEAWAEYQATLTPRTGAQP